MYKLVSCVAAGAALCLASCASTQSVTDPIQGGATKAARAAIDVSQGVRRGIDDTLESYEKPDDLVIADPYEDFNRRVFAFNTSLDRNVLAPTASAYESVVPKFGRDRVRDFIDHIKTPIWFVNETLQGDIDGAGVQASRFALNSVFGVAGLYDYAANVGDLPKRDEDFGQTLARWGVGNGPFLMLPLLGPTTGRDFVGRFADTAFDPLTWTQFEGRGAFVAAYRTTDVVDLRVLTDPAVQLVYESADPYAQARAVYVQARRSRIREGDGEADAYEDLPDFE